MPEVSTNTNPNMFCLPVGSYHNLSTPIPTKNNKKKLITLPKKNAQYASNISKQRISL